MIPDNSQPSCDQFILPMADSLASLGHLSHHLAGVDN